MSVFSYKEIIDWVYISTNSHVELQDRIRIILFLTEEFLLKHKVSDLNIEIPVYGQNANAFFMQACLYQALLDLCVRLRIRTQSVRPTQAKMWLENGTISKDRVFEVFRERYAINRALRLDKGDPLALDKSEREGLLDSLMIGMYGIGLNKYKWRKNDT